MAEQVDTSGVFAIPYTHNDPEKFQHIIDKCCEHRPWFDDFTWENPLFRRIAAIKYLSDAFSGGRVWEVWDGANLVGVLLLNKVRYRTDAHGHFVFFDHKLANKRVLCQNYLQWVFDNLDVHRVSVEIPTYARALASFVRKKLGFRYEAEARPFSWPKDAKQLSRGAAELGSRKHQAVRYKEQWHDVLLLSITRTEFESFARSSTSNRVGSRGSTTRRIGGRRTDSSDTTEPSGTSSGGSSDRSDFVVLPESSADSQPTPTDELPPTAVGRDVQPASRESSSATDQCSSRSDQRPDGGNPWR